MRRLPGGAGLLLGVVLLTALLAEGRGLPLRKQRGPRPRSHAKLAEVSGGRGAARARPPSGPLALAVRGSGLGREQRPLGARARPGVGQVHGASGAPTSRASLRGAQTSRKGSAVFRCVALSAPLLQQPCPGARSESARTERRPAFCRGAGQGAAS